MQEGNLTPFVVKFITSSNSTDISPERLQTSLPFKLDRNLDQSFHWHFQLNSIQKYHIFRSDGVTE